MRIVKGFYDGKLVIGIVNDNASWSGSPTHYIDMTGMVYHLSESVLSNKVEMEERSDKVCSDPQSYQQPRIETALREIGAKEINIRF